ncbi:uncharacterized protein LOC118800410 [Colossoma macropomum]|uniref:uncharacterized protein LOC118800410 n=1 Tax=Colossoma macropomum TaxID=42526 RepID=UPI001863E3FD|nr:uncharacterized protein LOC118800410 [Colossoma macropomum]
MQISSVTRPFHNIPCGAAKRIAATMSCLWFWCCRVHEADSDTDSNRKEEQQSEKRKKGKKKRSRRKWKIHWKKERKNNINKEEEAEKEKRPTNQQPAKVEEEADVLDLPVGLESGSLKSVSAETLENTAPPLQENLTEEGDEAIKHLMKMMLDEVETRIEQLLKAETVMMTVADEAAAEATNETISICLDKAEQKHLDHLVSTNNDVAEAIRELLEILFDDALSASVQPLAENEMMTVADEAAAEATNELMDINLDEPEEETLEKHLDHLVSSNNDAAEAIRELLEILFDDALSASLQPLGE